MTLFFSLLTLLVVHWSLHVQASPSGSHSNGAPTARVKNGTLRGRYSPEYDEDYFLGIPFAQPPVGELRFRIPQSMNSTWDGEYDATRLSNACVGYGSDQTPYEISEDCLYLNVIRPSGNYSDLPVIFWIHGGGYFQGSGVDQRYNQSFMVQNSVKIGKPIIGVSINYRLSAWGFLNSIEVEGTGNVNVGLRDQRLALHWVHENIAAFGGDPSKVTIQGESAGASSVGYQLTAYGGRDDKLFRGAIMQSGNPVFYGAMNGGSYYQPLFNQIVNNASCNNTLDRLDCLRHVPFEQLNAIINTTGIAQAWSPAVDGDFLEQYGSKALAEGRFLHVPIVDGANSDEGLSFAPPAINTTQQFYSYITQTAPPAYADEVLEAYPDIPAQGIPGSPPLGPLPPEFRFSGYPYGTQQRRVAAYTGDQSFIANRRLTCQTWAAAGLDAYCYRFNALPAGVDYVFHFQEIPFVFLNLLGVGFVAPGVVPPFQNKSEAYRDLARLMDSSWISFVHDGDPNTFRDESSSYVRGFLNGSQPWPKYSLDNPQDYVFDANVSSHPEPDTYRKEGIALINANNAGVYHR